MGSRTICFERIASVLVLILLMGLWLLPDLFAAGPISGRSSMGAGTHPSSSDRGASIPGQSIESSNKPSTPLSSSRTVPSIESYSPKDSRNSSSVESVETQDSPEGSVGMAATGSSGTGSKKKKTSGGWPPVDTTTVTASEGSTAGAIRGKPAHPESDSSDTKTKHIEKSTDLLGRGTGEASNEKASPAFWDLKENERAKPAHSEPDAKSESGITRQLKRSAHDKADEAGKARENIGNDDATENLNSIVFGGTERR